MAQAAAKAPDNAKERITYIPQEGDPHTTKWRGVEFKANVPYETSDADMIAVARGNKFFQVGDERNPDAPQGLPRDGMQYRGHVLGWFRTIESVEQLIRHWAGEQALRERCEVAFDDVAYLGTLIEPVLIRLRKAEGMSEKDVMNLWIKYGVLSLPWRAK
jgi:hypothetical protein